MKKLVIARRASQMVSLGLFIYILWSTTYPLTGIFPAETFFAIDPLIMLATALSQRFILPALGVSALMLALTLAFGRFFCGWICPLGTLMDGAGWRTKPGFTDASNRLLRRIKFFILGIIFLLALAGVQAAWLLDPTVIIARFVSLNFIPTVTLVTDWFFSSLIRLFSLYGPAYDFYRYLKTTLLGVRVHYFVHSAFLFLFFLIVLDTASRWQRFWCRGVCPLGALYGLLGRAALLRRIVKPCSKCMKCRSACRMAAIAEDLSTVRSECILCMDCLYGCPLRATRFSFAKDPQPAHDTAGISRRDFLKLAFVYAAASPAIDLSGRPKHRKRQPVIRPPASLAEEQFNDRCVRCGNCMKVCITNGLQPALFSAGAAGLWTPQLVPEIGYCEYHCTLCGTVCPTGAIPRISEAEKLKTRLGIARIDRTRCLPWKENKECLVCEEHCPTARKSIKLKKVPVNGRVIARPYMDPRLCIGCGICQTKCPVRPVRAIRVYPVRVTHADQDGRVGLE